MRIARSILLFLQGVALARSIPVVVHDGHSTAVDNQNIDSVETVYFAAGCYWSVELAFQRLPGVLETSVGFAGGSTTLPTYDRVVEGNTGHAETVEVIFNTRVVSFPELLRVFFSLHDPTTKNRQGGDVGTQYRSAIFATTPEQYKTAQAYIETYQNTLSRPIVTEITENPVYTRAAEYHQQYLEKLGQSSMKGALSPIRCYGNRGPWKQIKKSVHDLFQRKVGVDTPPIGQNHEEF